MIIYDHFRFNEDVPKIYKNPVLIISFSYHFMVLKIIIIIFFSAATGGPMLTQSDYRVSAIASGSSVLIILCCILGVIVSLDIITIFKACN